MRRCLLLGSLLGTLLSTGALVAQPEAPYFFLQMADPQFGMFSDNAGFEEETTRYEKAIAIANRLQPAFVVVCGDLVNTPGDSTQQAELDRISAQLDERIPPYLVSGNHDVGNAPSPESLRR